MDSSQLCKLFIGGLNVQTSESGLREHFESFGELTDCVVVVNPQTKRSRCFGFVTYVTADQADSAMDASPHVVDGSNVELKRAVSREDSIKPGAHAKVKKLFIGGLKEEIGEEDLHDHFSQFGSVEKVEIIADKQSGRKRGFGFVHFQNHDGADKAAVVKFHPINGHRVEVKKAVPKDDVGGQSSGGRGRGGPSGGRGGRGGRGGGMRDINGLSGGPAKSFGGGGYGGGYGASTGGYGASTGGYGASAYGGGGYSSGGAYGASAYGSSAGGGGYGDAGSAGYGNGFGSYGQQHQSSYGPVKSMGGGAVGAAGGWGRSSAASGPYRGGGGGGSYGASSYGGGSGAYGGGAGAYGGGY